MADAQTRLVEALNQAIGSQARSTIARVTSVAQASRGMIQAHTEAHGNIQVICRTTDRIQVHDWIYVGRSGPNKHDPFIYHGFSSANDGTQQPGTSPDAPIHVNPPVSDGGSTAPSGTLQYYLDQITKAIQEIKGIGWQSEVAQSLTQVINWRAPVASTSDLPVTGNRIADVRYAIATNDLWVWTASGWRGFSDSSASSASIALMRAGTGGISAFTLAALISSGIVPADITNTAHIGKVCGVTTESGGSGADVLVQLSGVITFPTALFGSYRGPVLVGTAGAFSTTLVSGAVFVQQAGVAVGSNELQLNLDSTIIVT